LPPSVPQADPMQTSAAAAQLTKLLAEFNPGAVEFTEANEAALRPLPHGDSWGQFVKLVQGYAFAEAQAQLIANAPNPAGYGILQDAKVFKEEGISPLGLFLGALLPTVIAIAFFWLLR